MEWSLWCTRLHVETSKSCVIALPLDMIVTECSGPKLVAEAVTTDRTRKNNKVLARAMQKG